MAEFEVTDEMVLAMAKASYRLEGTPEEWDLETGSVRSSYLIDARVQADAVADMIAAVAWQQGADSAFYEPEIRGYVDYPENPYAGGVGS